MTPEEIFADLIRFRKEILAPEVHTDYAVKPFRFMVYSPSFHFLPCQMMMRAQNDGSIANLRRTSSKLAGLTVCGNCINAWNWRFPRSRLYAGTFDLDIFFSQLIYDPHMWDGIDLPPEIDEEEFSSDCFLPYRPVRANRCFHFMKCSNVRYDESVGWIRFYRFTGRISGVFDMFDGRTQRLRPCLKCLAEWDGGKGWEGYSTASDEEKKRIKDSFSIREFFRYCQQQEHRPHELGELYQLIADNSVWFGASVDNEYPARSWDYISDMYRIAQGYRCEQCGLDMRKHTNLAIVHHVNGSHPEVSPDNMKVLCVWCHSKQPHHEKTVKLDRYTLKLLRKLWREQGIKP